jgi:hypothetical protein
LLKATIPHATVDRATVQQVEIGQLSAGPLSIGSLVLDGVRAGVSTGTVTLTNLSVTVTLELELDWSVSIHIPFDGRHGWSGSIDFGTQSITVGLGDVTVPGLENLDVDLGQLSVSDVSAVIGAIKGLRLGALVAEQISAGGTSAPSGGFTLAGLTLGSAGLVDLGVPAITIEQTKVAHVSGQALPLGTVTIPGLSLPGATVADITSDALDVSATSNPFEFTADAGLLKVTLKLTPGAEMQADELRMSGVRASASVGSVTLSNVVVPYDVLDITLGQLGIETVTIPSIEVN